MELQATKLTSRSGLNRKDNVKSVMEHFSALRSLLAFLGETLNGKNTTFMKHSLESLVTKRQVNHKKIALR